MRTLYVTDMDGTLLGADSRVSVRSAALISELSRRGALITVATARTPATVVPLLDGTCTRLPAIVMTGAALWHLAGDRTPARAAGTGSHYSRLTFIPGAQEATIEATCRSCGLEPFVYTLPRGDSDILQVYHGAPALNKAEDAFYQERRALPLKHFNLSTPVPPHCHSRKILYFAMGDAGAIFQAGKVLEQTTCCSVSYYPDIFNPRLGMLEVFAPGVSKAAAIRQLQADCGADRLVVFGDNLNDLSMMAVADLAVAVGNALPEVMAAAAVVTGPNTADSVAEFIAADFAKDC